MPQEDEEEQGRATVGQCLFGRAMPSYKDVDDTAYRSFKMKPREQNTKRDSSTRFLFSLYLLQAEPQNQIRLNNKSGLRQSLSYAATFPAFFHQLPLIPCDAGWCGVVRACKDS